MCQNPNSPTTYMHIFYTTVELVRKSDQNTRKVLMRQTILEKTGKSDLVIETRNRLGYLKPEIGSGT